MSLQDTRDTELQQLRRKAEGASPEAWFQLAQGLVARQEMEEAHDWHLRAAEAGFAAAQIELARMQLHGVGVAQSATQAVSWLLRAEASGHPVAAYMLALISVGGVAAPRDGRINQRVMAALNAGFPPALRAVAIHFGRKPDAQDQQRCLQLLDHAASRGDWVAALLLSERLARGEGCAVNMDAANRLRGQLQKGGIAPMPPLQVPQVATSTMGSLVASGTLALEDTLHPPAARVLSERPRVAVVDGLLSADECRLLVATAQPMLRRSQTIDPLTGEALPMQIRTSSDASFDPLIEDLSLRLVQQRMASAAAVELTQAEHLVVLRYEPGQEYRPHRDYRPAESLRGDVPEAGNRGRTICTYLNEPEAGGETEFPAAGLTIEPQAGRAVIFDNLLDDGSPDADSLHAGLPVLQGEKWLATLWLRQGRYRPF
jgi:prolyl 4-hydroxylase